MSWQLWALVSAIAAGLTSVFAKAGLEGVPSQLANAARTSVVLVLSIAILVASGEHQRTATLTPRAWLLLALSGCGTAVSWIAYFKALSLGNATPVAAIDKSSLVVTMVLSALFLHEKLSWRTVVGVLLVAGGAVLISTRPR